MRATALAEVGVGASHGGKAEQLGAAARGGLPVPPGVALASPLVDAVARGEAGAEAAVREAFEGLGGGPVAVRSSAVGEDSEGASFAGQHATVLGVRAADAAVEAVVRVWRSARSQAALAYRRRMGLGGEVQMGVVVQRLVPADCAGVLFTRCPLTGADERVIEAAWGLGETVVAGVVTPDRYRLRRDGAVVERTAGEKDVAIRFSHERGAVEERVGPDQASALCLGDPELAELNALAGRCEAHFGGHQDLEWAFWQGRLFLLQRRPITRGAR